MVRFILWVLLFATPALSSAQSLVINEYSCSNKSQTNNAFNDYDDWIEIYNTTNAPINVAGYHLSDKETNPTKWSIPAGLTIPANGYKVIYCSDRNTVQGNEYHTNFRLTQTKNDECIILANATGTIIDSIKVIKRTQKNHAMARTTNGGTAWGVALTPTPGASNNNVKQYYAVKPSPSQAGGFYPAAISVTLTTTEPNSVIRYTTDGSEPTAASTQYTAPISVATTRAIRAKTFSNNNNIPASFTETNTYIIGTTHTMPTFCLNGNFNSLFNNGTDELQHAIEYYDTNGQLIFKSEGDMKGHGNDSWAFPQKGMRFYTRDEYGFTNNIEAQLFTTTPRDEFDVVILKASGSDNYPAHSGLQSAHIRDAFCQTLADKYNLNVDIRSYRPIVVYINGQYWGLYELRERVDSDYTDYYYDQPKGKVDMLAFWGGLQLDEGSDTAWVALYNFMMSNNLAVQTNYDYVAARFDPMSLIDYFILNTFTVNSDWLNWNTAWWRGTKDAGVPWRYHLWDMDNTFNLGQNYTGLPTTGFEADPCDVEDLFPNDPEVPHTGMLNKMMENPGFRQLYINRYADLINTAFDCTSMITHLDSLAALLSPEMARHTQRWGGNVNEWQQNINNIKTQINGRCAAISGGMVDCYNLTGPYNVTVIVSPANAGAVVNNVQVNTLVPPSYPYAGNYYGNNNITLTAIADPTYTFQSWELNNNNALPNNTAGTINVALATQDTIIAQFKKKTVIGIEETLSNSGLSVYPSPTQNQLNILLTNRDGKKLSLSVVSVTGQLLYSRTNINFTQSGGQYLHTLDLNTLGLAPGVYFLRLDDGGKPTVAKFVYQPEN